MTKFTNVTASITRPANSTQFTAGDVIGSSAAPFALVFNDVTREASLGGMIVDAVCISNAYSATPPNARLYLFDESVAGSSDNAAFAPTDAEMETLVGVVDFSSWESGIPTASAAGNMASFRAGVNLPFHPTYRKVDAYNEVASLWGVLVERSTYTPTTGEKFTVRLGLIKE